MGVDRDEAARGRRQPGDTWAGERRDRDDRVGGQRGTRVDVEQPVAGAQRPDAGPQRDASRAEHLAQGADRGGAEQPQRLRLGGHHAERGVRDAAAAEVDCGHERELVDRERPRGLGWDREDQPLQLAALDAVEEGRDRGRLGGPGEGQRAGHRRLRHRADGDDQRVVCELLAAGDRHTAPGVDRVEGSTTELRALVARDRAEVERLRAAQPERAGHGRRAVDEGALGGEQADRHVRAGDVAQGEQRLDGGDAAAGDHDVRPRRADAAKVTVGFRHGGPPGARVRAGRRSRRAHRAAPRARGSAPCA